MLDNVRWVPLVWKCFGKNSKLSSCKDIDELLKNSSNLLQKNLMYRLSALIQKGIVDVKKITLVFAIGRKEYGSNGSYHDIT